LPAEKVHAIPYGIDVPERFTGRERTTPVRLLAVGRMVAKKAPVLTLDAFRRARDGSTAMRLDYVGSGPLLSSARHFVATLGLQDSVALLEGQTNQAVHALMRAADVFVQHSMCDPDTGDEEGLPVSILEAMAHGLPVVATRHAGIPEAVEHGVTGFLVEEGDSVAMAQRIQQLAGDHSLRIAMGRAGWERARRLFDWSLERDRLRAVLGLTDAA
jgi:glycosyltransferase involved in cell wall biosynthesis